MATVPKLTRLMQEPFVRPSSAIEQEAEEVREEQRLVVDSFGIVMPQNAVTEPLLLDNAIALTSGEYGGATLTKADTVLSGTVPGGVIAGAYVFENHALVTGLRFTNSPGHREGLITIRSPARVRFVGCTFDKGASLPGLMITVESGARAAFVGCQFKGGAPDGANIIDNQGAVAADVQLIACHRQSTNPFGTVTETGSI